MMFERVVRWVGGGWATIADTEEKLNQWARASVNFYPTHTRQEKELLVLVTPHLVAPMNPDEVPCLPTDAMTDPNDLEFYLLNRIEGRTGRPFYPTRE